ncbi:hypothetical protein HRI_000575600 [Hibiscus trionum]|uniref:Uncharacterized protein n=1 Tax=Hibiscus trionum TaxID=183268 RepID=A0A9W7LLF4_HIBTR|nr:hypothetical protein HRI_000575600 [Hibiscus trionum]
MEAKMMKTHLCLAIIVLVFCKPFRVMPMGTNGSTSVIGDDSDLEFLMDSHSSRFLQGNGNLAYGANSASIAPADCDRDSGHSCVPGQNPEPCIAEHNSPYNRRGGSC